MKFTIKLNKEKKSYEYYLTKILKCNIGTLMVLINLLLKVKTPCLDGNISTDFCYSVPKS